ncbi:MAG: hypothetical protein IPG50_34350 [Myxococcales bacterium]|nr:hypothetical protein [Myxococcales bacterium]
MLKSNKLGVSVPTDSLAGTAAALQRMLSPMAGFESGALKAAREMERLLKPLAGIENAAIARAARDMERMSNPIAGGALDALSRGALHRSMADHVTRLMGGEAMRSQLAAIDALGPALDAINSTKPMLDATRSVSPAFGAVARIHDLHRVLNAPFGLNSLDDVRRGVTGILGESRALASLDAFARVRDQLGGSLGLGAASQWDAFAATTSLSILAALSLPFDRPTAVMTLATRDQISGTLAWLEPALEPGVDGSPRVIVTALHPQQPAGSQPWRKLKIATGAAINCSNCGQPFDLNLQLWLTGEDLDVFFQGEMLPICGACGGDGNLLPDLPMIAPYRLIDGGGEGDSTAIGRLTLVVDNAREDDADE